MFLSERIAIWKIKKNFFRKKIKKLLINNDDKFIICTNNKSRIEKIELFQGMLFMVMQNKRVCFKFDY